MPKITDLPTINASDLLDTDEVVINRGGVATYKMLKSNLYKANYNYHEATFTPTDMASLAAGITILPAPANPDDFYVYDKIIVESSLGAGNQMGISGKDMFVYEGLSWFTRFISIQQSWFFAFGNGGATGSRSLWEISAMGDNLYPTPFYNTQISGGGSQTGLELGFISDGPFNFTGTEGPDDYIRFKVYYRVESWGSNL